MTTTTPKTFALRNKIHGNLTLFTDWGDYVLVQNVPAGSCLTDESRRMKREEARDEWSTIRAYSEPVSL